MRKIALVTAAIAAFASAPSFAAPSTVAQHNAAINSVRVQAAQPAAVHRYKVSQREFATQFNGSYKLKNGSEVQLSSRGSRFFASLDGQQEVEMLSVTPNVFVSVDAKLQVSFDKDATQGDDIFVRVNG